MSSSPPHSNLLKGLYLILDPQAFRGRDLGDVLLAAAAAGARLFQLRDKTSSMGEAYQLAIRLRRASADVGATLIINDRCDLAMAVDADGVHLGQTDLPLTHAREVMGPSKLIGISTHNLGQVETATRGGADYIGFGPIFETGTKPDHEPVVGLDGLRSARQYTDLPIFAIGGLTPENSASALAAGATGVAVISAIGKASEVGAAVKTFLERLP